MNENKRCFRWGLTAFLTVLALLLCWIFLTNYTGVAATFKKFIRIISPIIYGFTFAYLLNPIVKAVEQPIVRKMTQKGKAKAFSEKLGRILGIIAAMVVVVALILLIVLVIVPELAETISGIVSNLPSYYTSAETWVLKLLNKQPQLQEYADQAMTWLYNALENWATSGLATTLQKVMSVVTSSVYGILSGLLYIIIGIIVSVYVLYERDRFLAQAKKITIALWKEEKANRMMELMRRTHRIFGGFVYGKLLDSLIIGLLCFIVMSILRLPYPLLVSVIVGVTNVIPFFGPFIGAIPSAFLILLVSPLQCLYFVIFVFLLQQFDGNILGPKILGDATGLNGFWVIVVITVAGGMFGFAGMLLGVPVFAVIFTLIVDSVNQKLRKKNLRTDSDSYITIKTVEDLTPQEETPAEPVPAEPET